MTPADAPVLPGAVWYARGTSGHPPGEPVRVVKLTPWSVVYRPLAAHARRMKGGERKKTIRREVFLALYRPRRP